MLSDPGFEALSDPLANNGYAPAVLGDGWVIVSDGMANGNCQAWLSGNGPSAPGAQGLALRTGYDDARHCSLQQTTTAIFHTGDVISLSVDFRMPNYTGWGSYEDYNVVVGTPSGQLLININEGNHPLAGVDVWQTLTASAVVPASFDGKAIVVTATAWDWKANRYFISDNWVLTPEPMTMSLLALGGLGLLRRRR